MKRQAIAVVGSGTDVGKTFVSCALIAELEAFSFVPLPRKPVVSGVDPAAMADSDTDRLLTAAGIVVDDANRDLVSPFRFRAPLAPNEAARREGVVLDHAAIVEACSVVEGHSRELIVLETAGGVMSPLTDTTTQLDLVVDVGAMALLVVEGSYLGWISHTLTALFALQTRGVPVVAIVVNHGVTEPLHPFVGDVPVFVVDDLVGIVGAVYDAVMVKIERDRRG